MWHERGTRVGDITRVVIEQLICTILVKQEDVIDVIDGGKSCMSDFND